MWSEFRYALRQWRKSKALAAVVIFLLGIGIGANTLIFSFIDATILRPLPVRNPQNLYLVEKNRAKQVRPDSGCFYRVYVAIRARRDVFSAAVASQEWGESSFQPLEIGNRAKLVSTEIISPNYFSELGVNAVLGRALGPADAEVTSGIPVVISNRFWQSEMNGSRNVLGQKLRIKGFPFQIVGVLPEAFHGLDIDRVPDVWLPISAARIFTGHSVFEAALTQFGQPTNQFQVLVRLAPGIMPAAAAAAVLREIQNTETAVLRPFYTLHKPVSGITQAQLNAMLSNKMAYKVGLQSVTRGLSRMRQQFSAALYVLIGAVGLLLVAVCASVSGMLFAKAEQRKREIAVRVALGARRAQLLRQAFVESLLWTIPSVGLALFFYYTMAPAFIGMLPAVRGLTPIYATPPVLNVSLDRRVILFVAAACLLTVFLSGLGAAWRAAKVDVIEDLKQQQESKLGGFSGIITIGVQVSISVVLVAGAVLMLKTFWTLQHLNPGFDRAHIIEFDLNPKIAGYSDSRAQTFLRELRDEIALLPGVRSVAGAEMGLMQGVGFGETVIPEGEVLPEKTLLNTSANVVTPGYFQTLGIPLLAGRLLEEPDRNHKPQPVW